MSSSRQIKFALNHMAAPRLSCRAFIDLAASLGCEGIELRNDLADKKLTDADFFDGGDAKSVGDYARSKGLRLLGLSEADGFNAWSEVMRAKVQLLIDQAKAAGAESISLIPRNDAPVYASNAERLTGNEAHGRGENALDAASRLLDLPADEVSAVVFESERDARHKNATAASTAAVCYLADES